MLQEIVVPFDGNIELKEDGTYEYIESDETVVQLTDGRNINLKEDGTYEFIEITGSIEIIPLDCNDFFKHKEYKDDFGTTTEHGYWFGFKIKYKVNNYTAYPIVLKDLVVRYSKDYHQSWTQISLTNYENPINSNESITIDDEWGIHMFYINTNSKKELNIDEINKLKIENGCTPDNFNNQNISIILSRTKITTHPDAGNIDWKELI